MHRERQEGVHPRLLSGRTPRHVKISAYYTTLHKTVLHGMIGKEQGITLCWIERNLNASYHLHP